MKSVIEYLDDLKEKTGSDYKSAKMLNVKGSTISMIRSRGQMSDETAVKMADILEVDRGEVLLAAAMARSNGETLSAWNALAKRLSVAAGVVLVVGLSLRGGDIKAAGIDKNCQEYTLCEVIRKRLVNCVRAVFHCLESKTWLSQGNPASTIPGGIVAA